MDKHVILYGVTNIVYGVWNVCLGIGVVTNLVVTNLVVIVFILGQPSQSQV